MMDAITKADSTDPQKIVDAIAATDGEFVCGPIKFDANHSPPRSSHLVTQWQSGKSESSSGRRHGDGQAIFPLP